MKIYLIRHGIAEERHIFAQKHSDDSKRPLTNRGRDRLLKTGEFLKEHEPSLDLFLQSPLARAQQTVDVLKKFYPDTKVQTTENLAPSLSAPRLYQEISGHFDKDALALVGHEPDLGQFLSWILFRQASEKFPLKKGSVAKLDVFPNQQSSLKWLIRPKFF